MSLRLTSVGRAGISRVDFDRITARTNALDVRAGAVWSDRHSQWSVSVSSDTRSTFTSKGDLAEALDAALDDFERTLFTPDELVQIQKQSAA